MLMADKKPAVRWKKYQQTQASETTIRGWFARGTPSGIAVIFGEVSGGLASRDFDTDSTYLEWTHKHLDLAESLPTVKTHRGFHIYFRVNAGRLAEIRTHLGKPPGTGAIDFGDGELRADVGCYSVLPPSRHPKGSIYKWIVEPYEDLPLLDPMDAGFLDTINVTERNRENRGERMKTEAIRGGVFGGEISVASPTEWDESIDTAIRESLPSGFGKRHRQVFELARALKAIPALADADVRDLKPYVRRWHKLAKPSIKTKPFEETWIDFLHAWPRVKFPKGEEPMANILTLARISDPPECSIQFEQPKLRLLVSLCRELQRAVGDGPFYLSCRTAGRLVGVGHLTAWRWLSLLESEQILRVVEKGNATTKRASRFRYLS